MRVAAVVDALAADLAALGALGDDAVAETARRLAVAMEGPLTARIIEAAGQLAAELTATLADGRVEVRLAGGDADLVIVADTVGRDGTDTEADTDGEASARITLRLTPQLKSSVESAAAQEGVSVNTYIVRALLGHRSRPPRGPTVGRKLTGYGRA